MNELENYYGKFCEDKRLLRKHGQVEYRTSMKYIHDYLKAGDRILDIGAGTGRYSVALSQEGYEVDAIELVKYNLGMLKAKKSNVIKIKFEELENYIPNDTYNPEENNSDDIKFLIFEALEFYIANKKE